MNAKKVQSEAPRTKSQTQLRPVRSSLSIPPPSFARSLRGDPNEAIAWLDFASAWAADERRTLDAIHAAKSSIDAEDATARCVLEVTAVLTESLHALRIAFHRLAVRRLVAVDAALAAQVRTLSMLARDTAVSLGDRSCRQQHWLFWMLAEHLSLVTRIDVREWLVRRDDVEPPQVGACGAAAALVNAGAAALVPALRALAPARETTPPATLGELEAYVPSEDSLRATLTPPSHKRTVR